MVNVIAVVAAAMVVLAPAAGASAADPGAAKPEGRGAAAVELSRMILPPETWDRSLRAVQQQTVQQILQMTERMGGSLDPDFARVFGEEFSKMVPYQEVLDTQAGILAKHYTEEEILQLVAFYRTPLGQKMIRVMPEVTADVSGWSLSIMQRRMASIMERLKPYIHERGDGEAPSEDAPAKQPPPAPAQ